jgi:Protein of unknown function (DUF2799)
MSEENQTAHDPRVTLHASLLFVLLVLVAGCATLNKDQCLRADWYAIGLEDGARGQPLERAGDHRRACAEHGVTPRIEPYLAGRNEGLKSYCTYEKGLSVGRAGQSYSGVCPAGLAGNFTAGFQRGKDTYDLRRRLETVNEQIRKTKAALTAGIPNPRVREAEVARLEDLSREAEQLEQRIAALEGR